jgi:hypothetical protein
LGATGRCHQKRLFLMVFVESCGMTVEIIQKLCQKTVDTRLVLMEAFLQSRHFAQKSNKRQNRNN